MGNKVLGCSCCVVPGVWFSCPEHVECVPLEPCGSVSGWRGLEWDVPYKIGWFAGARCNRVVLLTFLSVRFPPTVDVLVYA